MRKHALTQRKVYLIIQLKRQIVEKLLKSKSIFDSNLTIINEERPNIKINLKEKYLKYKAKYLQLKNQLNF